MMMMMMMMNVVMKSLNEPEFPRGVMVKALSCGVVVKRVRTPVALLLSLSDMYP